MTHQLAKSAQSVQAALDRAGLSCKVLELPSSTRTAVDAAKSIGCDIAQIVKSLIFKTKETERPVLVLASGSNRVKEKLIEQILGEKLTKAEAAFAKEITGFAIGGIPPVGHKHEVELIFIDHDLMALDKVWAAAGTPNAVFEIKSDDLCTITNGQIVVIS